MSNEEIKARLNPLLDLMRQMGDKIAKIDEMMRNGELVYKPKHKACGTYLVYRQAALPPRFRRGDWQNEYECPECKVDITFVKKDRPEELIKCMGQ